MSESSGDNRPKITLKELREISKKPLLHGEAGTAALFQDTETAPWSGVEGKLEAINSTSTDRDQPGSEIILSILSRGLVPAKMQAESGLATFLSNDKEISDEPTVSGRRVG